MANTFIEIPSLGSKFVDYRQPIWGDSFNWSWNRPLSQVKYLVIHHTVTKHEATPDDIALLHKARGWGGIGYHFVITKDGTVYYVGDIGTARANVLNKNHLVLGIALVGDFTKHLPSDEQITSAHLLVTRLIEIVPNVKGWGDVEGHKDFQATACPGTSWNGELGGMEDRIEKNIPYTPAPKPSEKYQIVYKDNIIEELDENPIDEIRDTKIKLENSQEEVAKLIQENTELLTDKRELSEDISTFRINLGEARAGRDTARSDLKTTGDALETSMTKQADLQAKLDAKDPISKYSKRELFSIILKRIFRR